MGGNDAARERLPLHRNDLRSVDAEQGDERALARERRGPKRTAGIAPVPPGTAAATSHPLEHQLLAKRPRPGVLWGLRSAARPHVEQLLAQHARIQELCSP